MRAVLEGAGIVNSYEGTCARLENWYGLSVVRMV